MNHYIGFESRLFLKDPKNKLMFLAFLAFLLFVYFLIFFQSVGDNEEELYQTMNQNRFVTSTISESTREDPELSEFYDNVYSQHQLVVRQEVGRLFEEDNWYLDSGIELAELQRDLHQYDLNLVDEEVRDIIPTLHQAESNLAFYTYLKEEAIPIMTDRQQTAGYTLTLLEYFGLVAFLFLLLFSCGILSNDLNHQTMVKGYPLSYEQKTGSKIIIYTIASFLSVLVLSGLAIGVISLIYGTGNFAYPIPFYGSDSVSILTVLGYSWRYLLYFLVLSIHVISLSAILNTLTKNMYATLFIGTFLYFIPMLFQSTAHLWHWLPLPFYNMHTVLSGEVAYSAGLSHLNYLYGMGILLLWSIGFLVSIYVYQRLTSNKSATQLNLETT